MSRVCVVGLGKLGSVMAAVFANAGHEVVGVDVDRDAVGRINQGIAPVDEPGLQELIDKNRPRLIATHHYPDAVQSTDVAFVIVPTPSKDDGFFDHSMVLQAAIEIGTCIRDTRTDPYTVVVASTVMPGTCENVIQPAIDAAAGRHVPVLYSPEFIALGSVIQDMTHPDIVLIGANDPGGLADLVGVIREVVENQPVFHLLSLVDAELAKISVNSFVTMKISFANQVAAICEGVDGAHAGDILNAIGGDSRIGRSYLKPGGPYGGPCFPRDNRAFQAMANRAFADAPLAAAADLVNDQVVQRIIGLIPTWGTVAILGMTYKPDTSVQTESLGSLLIEHFDAAASHDPTSIHTDAQELVDATDHIIVATAWPEYAELDYHQNATVVDVWNIVPDYHNVYRLGVGP